MLMRHCEEYNIMALDDEDLFLQSLENLLLSKDSEGYGYNLVTFSDHNKALEELRNNIGYYDLLLLDFQLEDCDGYEIVKKIREFDNTLYIVFLTAKAKKPKDNNFESTREVGVSALDLVVDLKVQGFFDKLNSSDHLLAMIYTTLSEIDMKNSIRTIRDGFKKILDFSQNIYGFKTLNILLNNILEHLLNLIQSKDVFLLIYSGGKNQDETKLLLKGKGKFENSTTEDILYPDNNIELTKDIIVMLSEVKEQKKTCVNKTSMCVPVLDVKSKEYLGCMYIIIDTKTLTKTDTESVQSLLEVYANQAALTINNSILYSEYTSQKDDANTQYEKMKRHYKGTVDILRNAIDAKNAYTKGHSDRVAEYAYGIGEIWFGNSKEKLDKLKRAGYFHDIGKLSVPDEILDKPDKLTQLEYTKIQEHPDRGYAILNAVDMFQDILHIIQNHHENLAGEGYPRGLIDSEIDDMTRIISISDSYDAMTSGRKYQARKTPLEAINDLLLKSNFNLKGNPLKDNNGRAMEGYYYDRNFVNSLVEYLITTKKAQLKRDPDGNLADMDKVPEYVLQIENDIIEERKLKATSLNNVIDD